MSIPTVFTPALQAKYYKPGHLMAVVSGVVLALTSLTPWSYSSKALDNMTYLGSPSVLQLFGAALGLSVALCAAMIWIEPRLMEGTGLVKTLGRISKRFAYIRGAKAGGIGAAAFMGVTLLAIAIETGGIVNVEWGGWLAFASALVALVSTRLLTAGRESTLLRVPKYPVLEIGAIVAVMALALFGAAYVLAQDDGGAFVVALAFVGAVAGLAVKTGFAGWMGLVGNRHRSVLILSAFVVAFLFPFTQNGKDANMSIAIQVLIFAATAIGLNIVVGLAGLLDLGYIAFLGAGAFTAAVLSESMYATLFQVKPPFLVTMIISGIVAALLGLVIGSPTLRVSGDYLAIVTLAFGEIFRLSMNNLNGINGPNVVRGSNGIANIPDLKLFGFDFGADHAIGPFVLTRFANYFFLVLIIMALIILVFTRLNHSRIGRGWVAIREDEKAAEAMGVNIFGLKLLAFAGGAFLAGVAGSVKAHVDTQAIPGSFEFLESAFLLAAVVLGGMGTVTGVLLGATILKLLPEKLRFISEYRMLIFGLLLVLMMRFRPEGMIPNQRRALEFHDEDEALVEHIEDNLPYEFAEVK